MAKAMEITFAIGAALTGGFSGVFGKAGQALSQLQKQSQTLQKTSGQISAYQKMQGVMSQTAEKLNAARARVKELGIQMRSTNAPTAALKKEFTAANVEAHRLEVSLGNQRKKLGELRTGLTEAGVSTKNLTSEQARLAQQSQKVADAQTRLQNSRAALEATKQNLSWNNIKGDLMTSAGLGLSLAAPVNQAASFQQAMARVQAVAFTGKGKTAEQKAADAEAFKQLQEQARQLGRDTQFTATQAAQSQENLARAGFKSREIIAAMPGLLSMAAAEGMDLAQAADIAASTLRGFNLSADQSNRVADVLAQMSAASNTNIAELGESMKYVAPVAAGLGVSIEETASMLGVMANSGIKGSQAGTALRAAFNRLSKEPKAVEKALNALGVASRDAQGNLRKMPGLMQELADKMKNMGTGDRMQYLTNIFGQEAAAGMLAVMNASIDGTLANLENLGREATGALDAIAKLGNTNLDELTQNVRAIYPITQQLGFSFNETGAMLGVMAKAGIKGSQAWQMLDMAFKQFLKNPKQTEKAFKSIGISIKDAQGNMKTMPVLLQELSTQMKGMKDADQLKALSKIFGDTTAPGIQTLLKGIADGTNKELLEAAKNGTGVAKDMADVMNNTMRGAFIKLDSATQNLMIEIGDVLLPTVQAAADVFTKWTSNLGKLAKEYPTVTKCVVGFVAGVAALKVGITGLKIAWNLTKLPFQTARVAFDWLNAKLIANGHASLFAAAKTKILAGTQKAWQLVMKGGRKLLDIGRLTLYYGKQILITTATKAWTAAQWLWNAALNANPIGLIITAIAGAIAIGYALYKNWDKLKELWNSWTIKDIFACIKGFAKSAYDWVVQKWNEFFALWDSWTLPDIFAPVKEYASNAYNWASQKWQEFTTWWDTVSLKNIFPESFSGIFDFFAKDFESAKTVLAGQWQTLKSIFTLDFEGMWDGILTTFDGIKGFITNRWETLKSIFTIDFGGLWDTLSSGFLTVCDTIKSAWNGVTGFIKDTWNTVADSVSGAWDWTMGLFEFGPDEAETQQQALQAQVKDITVLNKMSEGFADRVAEMTAAWQPFKESLGAGFTEIFTTMQGVADKIRGVTIPAVNELVSALGKVATELTAIVQAGNLNVQVSAPNGGGGYSTSRMAGGRNRNPRFAEGGFVDGETQAIVGEAGREAIIPIEKRSRGIPLWLAAGREMGLAFGSPMTNNNCSQTVNLSPNINITVNGGEAGIETKFRAIIEDVLRNLQDDMQRVSFA